MDPSDHHQGAAAPNAPQPQQHQRRRSALEGTATASPLVVGPGGLALLNLGTGSPARLRSGSGSRGSVESPTRTGVTAAAAGPLGGSSPLSSYALRVMRERAAAAAGGGGDGGVSAALEEKGDYGMMSIGQGTRRRSSSGSIGGVGDGARLSSLSYAAGAPSPPSGNKSPAAHVRIRSVEEEDDEEGEAAAASVDGQRTGCGHACGAGSGGCGHQGLSASGSSGGGTSSSSSSSSASMCCRNCGSSEVVKVRLCDVAH